MLPRRLQVERASPDEHVVQLTVLGGGDGGPTSWFGPVSEEEYRGQ